jgi:hypothetical protein
MEEAEGRSCKVMLGKPAWVGYKKPCRIEQELCCLPQLKENGSIKIGHFENKENSFNE